MRCETARSRIHILIASVLLLCSLAVPITAQVMKRGFQPLDPITFAKPELWVTAQNEQFAEFRTSVPAPVAEGFDRMQAIEGVRWTMRFDRVTGKPAHMEGEGIPWIPGTANKLSGEAFGLPSFVEGKDVPVRLVADKALEFLNRYPEILGVKPDYLALNEVASGPVLDYLYTIDFDLVYFGIPVEKAHIVFRLNHGNLIQIGQEFVSDNLATLDPNPSISLSTAWEIVWGYAGRDGDETIVDSGTLRVVPVSSPEVLSSALVVPGSGLNYRLVYLLTFRKPGVIGTWQARVDAHNGEILSFLDANEYGHIEGGAYKTDGFPSVTIVPYPYANYGSGLYADGAGDFTGTTGTCTLTGQYVRILSGKTASEGCNTTTTTEISLAADASGLINFSTSSGTDCTTPGIGGVGNTHAARTQYWNVTQIKLKALAYLPTNNWLQGQLTDYVNRVAYCNAYWDGTAVNFFKSVSGCANLGELPGVSLHEWAHGLDANDGRASADRTTGESYGDFSGTLQTHSSCAGMGAFGNTKCDGYGDSCRTCTGIRDMDYAAHSSGAPWTPDMYDNGSGFTCAPYGYPNGSYPGLCRYEGHCESGVSSQALWDLAVRDLPAMGIDSVTAWQIMDRLWYASRPSQQSAFNCPSITTTDGSNTGSFYNIFRAVDDCDGNLTNGTPHANAIFDAMARHKMAVGADGDATNQNQTSCCPTLATPSLSGTAASCQNNLSWGSITNAAKYNMYRNETGCTMGFTLIGTVTAPTVTFSDANVSEGSSYYYRLQAVGTSDACTSAMSNCVTLTAAACGGCTAPSTPAGLTITDNCTPVDLSWSAVSGADGYNIYRYTGTCTGATWTKIGTATGTTYSDSGAASGTTYAWMVRAYAGADTCESGNSNCVSATALATPATPTAPAPTDTCTGISLSWTAVSGATSYIIQRGTKSNCSSQSQIGTSATNSYTDTTASIGTTYYYNLIAVNSCGNSTASSCSAAAVHNLVAPTVSVTPDGTTSVCVGTNIVFTCTVTGGSGAYTYQWTRDGSNITGATTSTHTATYATAQSHTYNCNVTDPSGCTGTFTDASNSTGTWTAAHTVNVTPDGTTTRCVGVNIVFTAAVTGGTGPFTYQWTEDGANISGATISTYTANKATAQSHLYNCQVTDTAGCPGSVGDATSSTGTWTGPSHTVNVTPDGITTVCLGANIVFTAAAAGGTGPYGYQWTRDGGNISGATSSTYTATYGTAQSHAYNCLVTDTGGCPGQIQDAASSTGTWQACIPNIVYQSNLAPTAINEDGDGIMEAGEKWQISVTVTNNGLAAANAVLGSLAGEGIEVCNNPGTFGNIAIGGTGSYIFQFIPMTSAWYGTYACGSSIGFDLTTKSSDSGAYTYANDTNFYSAQVGSTAGDETATAADQTVKNTTKDATFAPSFVASTCITATVAYTLGGNVDLVNCVEIVLVAPDAATTTLKAAGVADANPYSVTAFYNAHGAGTYILRITEVSGCGAANESCSVTGITMAITNSGGGGPGCTSWTATCANCNMTVDVTPNGTSTVCTGTNIVFTATQTGGTSPFTYQWAENGTDISGATNSTYTASKASAGTFTYNCKVDDSAGCLDVADATASSSTWVAPPAVDVTPNGTTTVCTGANIVFTATVTGGASPVYQWTENGTNISGATNSTYTVTKASAGSFNYTCVVYNTGCATTVTDATPSTGTWVAPPTGVTVTPSGATTVCTGANIVFTATVTGGASPVYQWTENGTNISGATNSTYAVTKASAGSFNYTCVVYNTGCATTVTDATPSTGTWVAPPTGVTVTPSGTTTVCTGANIIFTATVVGGATPVYQWTENGTNISGATNSTYTATKASAGSFNYTCVVYNTGCTTTVTDATPSTGTWVAPPTSVTVTPSGTTTVCTGANIIFTATVVGGATPVYQWTENGTNISGATNSTYTANKASAGSFTYTCVVYNTGCTTTVTDATPSIGTWVATPTVDVTPASSTVCTGAAIVFTATASGGTAPYTYQWTEGGTDISGATNSTYSASKASAGTFSYNCKVYSSGCATAGTDATASTGTWVAPPTSVTVTPSGTTTVCTGANIVFTVTVAGGATPVYQWTENGSNISGATNSTYTASKAAAGSYTYTCVVYNTGCITTVTDATPSTGTWVAAPTVNVTPASSTVCTGAAIVFTATASGGTAPYTYQWTEGGTDISGATNSTYNASKAFAGTFSYNCKAYSTGCATAGTDATASTGTWVAAPTVNVTPNGTTTVCTSANIVFSATASGGTAPYSYQWTENETNISGATNSTYTASKAATGFYTYNCSVTSAGCATVGTDATASTGAWVSPPTSVTVAPSGTTTACIGANIVFAATVVGGASPVYQWTENGTNIAGATDNIYAANKATTGSYTYTCVVYNTGCTTTVTDATPSTGTWVAAPTVDVTPNGTTSVTVGNLITFTASASGGTAPYTYQWTRDGGDIAGAVNSTLTETYGTAQSHTYNCKVASSGCATSAQDAAPSTGDWFAGAVPGEVPTQSWTDKQTQVWDMVATATGYRLHRGQLAGLTALLDATSDSCTRYDGSSNTLGTMTEDPAALAPGDFYWYLVIAYNGSGDGSAGTATAGPRIVNTSGLCP